MKQFFSEMRRVMQEIRALVISKTIPSQRTTLRTEDNKQQEMEAERLDRLRNPSNYRGR